MTERSRSWQHLSEDASRNFFDLFGLNVKGNRLRLHNRFRAKLRHFKLCAALESLTVLRFLTAESQKNLWFSLMSGKIVD